VPATRRISRRPIWSLVRSILRLGGLRPFRRRATTGTAGADA